MIVIALLGLVMSINAIGVVNQDLNNKGWWIDGLTHLILYKRIPSAQLVSTCDGLLSIQLIHMEQVKRVNPIV